jgi:prevent-host-death family protein
VSTRPEISQRDLRARPVDIVDAAARGQAFTVTREGRPIGELVPLRWRRRFVSRREFTAVSSTAATAELSGFRADQDMAAASGLADP